MRIHAESALGAARPPRSSGPRPFSWWGRDARCRTARRLRSGDGGRAPDRRGDRSPRERLRGAGSVSVFWRSSSRYSSWRHSASAASEATPPAVEGVLTASYPGASFDHAGGGRLRRFRSHSLGNRPSPSAPGGGGPRDDARGGLFADRRRASCRRGPGRTTPSPHPPSPRPDAGSWAVPSPLWRLPVTAIRPIVPLTPSWRRRPARDRWSGVVIGTGTRT